MREALRVNADREGANTGNGAIVFNTLWGTLKGAEQETSFDGIKTLTVSCVQS
jgi:hypothetical protein